MRVELVNLHSDVTRVRLSRRISLKSRDVRVDQTRDVDGPSLMTMIHEDVAAEAQTVAIQ